MSSAIFLWLIFLSAIAFANLIFSIAGQCNIIRDMMSRKFSPKLTEDEKDKIIQNMNEIFKLRGFSNLRAYLLEYYEKGEFSGPNRMRFKRLKALKEIEFLNFMINVADDLGASLDYIFAKLGPQLPLYRSPKIKK